MNMKVSKKKLLCSYICEYDRCHDQYMNINAPSERIGH